MKLIDTEISWSSAKFPTFNISTNISHEKTNDKLDELFFIAKKVKKNNEKEAEEWILKWFPIYANEMKNKQLD